MPPKSLRLESFSDAVLAIILTIMVLDLHPPLGHSLHDLIPLLPIIGSYILSFIYLIIYWNNHHHLMRFMKRPTAGIMWSNAHLLFWLSLVPFTTAWAGETGFAFAPTVLYGINLLLAAIAYFMLQGYIIRDTGGEHSPLSKALGKDTKGRLSPILYIAALLVAFINPAISYFFFILVAVMWFIPDRRLENGIKE